MGMFDSFYAADEESAKQIVCAAGHPQSSELQTKDLECDMNEFYIFNRKLFKVERRGDPKKNSNIQIANEELVIEHRTYAKPCSLTKSILAYRCCKECDPIIIERDAGLWGSISERYVWNEWELFFDNGFLVRVVPVKQQTREDLRAEILKGGCDHVLDDDDRIAKKHLDQLKQGK